MSLATWAPASLAAVALVTGVAGVYAQRSVFSADGFAERADAALETQAVGGEVARRLTDAALATQPDLIAVRPIVESVADGVVRGAAFRSLVRRAARDVHRSVFDRHQNTVTLTVADGGVLLAEALRYLRPELAQQIPAGLPVRISTAKSEVETAAVRAADVAARVRLVTPVALVGALALALFAIRRGGATGLGVCVAVVSGLAAVASLIAPWLITSDATSRALLEVWLDPLAVWFGALAVAGAVAAASLRRPGFVRSPWLRWVAVTAAGVALIFEPRIVLMAAGILLVVAGASELLRLAARGAPPRVRVPRAARVATVAGALGLVLAGAVYAAGGDPEPERVGRCNGRADLCDRPLDQVAFVGTHNSMAADGEPGWLFVAQDAGMAAQLREGVRALMIDTHYGFSTPRGVATDLARESKSRAKVVGEVGERFVDTALRLRERIGYTAGGTREVFLCHAFCEVGATRAVPALNDVHRFLVTHPEEVLILSIEDDTDAESTAAAIRESGLIREVYRGPARPPWPTLRELIERDERVLVLIENEPGEEPWMHRQSDVLQETPYNFRTVAELGAESSCQPHRGGVAGSLLLVNHWVDTSPAPRKTIASEVNARPFLQPRLARCRAERRMTANIVAVDFYRQGDVFGTVLGP